MTSTSTVYNIHVFSPTSIVFIPTLCHNTFTHQIDLFLGCAQNTKYDVPRQLTWQWKIHQFESMFFLSKLRKFPASHVSFRGCKPWLCVHFFVARWPGLAADSFAWFALLQGTVHRVVLSPGRGPGCILLDTPYAM